MKGMRQLETLRHRWEVNFITDLKMGFDWNHLALHRDTVLVLVNMAVGFSFILTNKCTQLSLRSE